MSSAQGENSQVQCKGRLPWLKFFPTEHTSDPALRLCSLAARGLWMEMLSIMYASERFGHLTVNGTPMEPVQLSRLVGEGTDIVVALVKELESAGVFSRSDDGAIFSRRLLRDSEYRIRQQESGRRGGNPSLVGKKTGVKAPLKATLKPEQSRARAQLADALASAKSENAARAVGVCADAHATDGGGGDDDDDDDEDEDEDDNFRKGKGFRL